MILESLIFDILCFFLIRTMLNLYFYFIEIEYLNGGGIWIEIFYGKMLCKYYRVDF